MISLRVSFVFHCSTYWLVLQVNEPIPKGQSPIQYSMPCSSRYTQWLSNLLWVILWNQTNTFSLFSTQTGYPRCRNLNVILSQVTPRKTIHRVIFFNSLVPLFAHENIFQETKAIYKWNEQTNEQDVVSPVNEDHRVQMNIVQQFIPSTFQPYLFLRNPHVQTILGVFLRRIKSCAYIITRTRQNIISSDNSVTMDTWVQPLQLLPGVVSSIISGLVQQNESKQNPSFWDQRECIDTPDRDFFHVDYKWYTSKMKQVRHMVIILHGLESSSHSPLSIDMAQAFHNQGFDVAFINFRGCSGIPNNKLAGYHAGFTDDLLFFMSIMRKRWGNDLTLYLSGFSLGSNVVIKCLGDLGEKAISDFNIQGAAVMGCPFDLNIQYRRLVDDPFNRLVYTRTLLRTLKEKAEYNFQEYCNGDEDTSLFDYNTCRNAETIVDIEDGLIVPVFGFRDKFDYYNQSASITVMENIAIPTLIVNAKDDPFFDSSYFPWHQDCNHGGKAPIKLVRTEYGGHLGYIFHLWSDTNDEEVPSSSWISTELARFSKHVRDSKQ